MSRGGAPGGGAVVLDVAQLEALSTRTFSIGLDAGRGTETVALVRLRLSRALPGAAEPPAMAAGALATQPGVATEQTAPARGLSLRPRLRPHRPRGRDQVPAAGSAVPPRPRTGPADAGHQRDRLPVPAGRAAGGALVRRPAR